MATNKRAALQKIANNIKNCKKCKAGKTGLAVPGEGSPDAKLMFVGEAPGLQESLTGRPFIGRSGKLLTRLLTEIGIDRKDVFITSACKYFPGRRAPTPAEIAQEKPFLDRQIKIIDPKLIVLLGNTAIKALLGPGYPIGKFHGQTIAKNGRAYFMAYHPAAAVRFQKNLVLIRGDFQKLKSILN